MEARHHGPDRDVEDLSSIRVGELSDVDEHDHVSEVVRHIGEGLDDRVLAQPLEHTLLVGVLTGHLRLELVVEVVVAGLAVERRRCRGALLSPAAVDVQVREDPQQPRAQVRPGRVLPPRAKRALVGLLHEVVGLLARARQTACNAVDLVTQLQRLLLEANTVPRFLSEPTAIGG